MEYVDFGRTGLRVSRLAIGTGTNGFGGRSEQTALGIEGLANLLREAYDHGVNFWDAADGYGSHPHVARALQGVPRDKGGIATKTMSRHGQQVTQDIERYLALEPQAAAYYHRVMLPEEADELLQAEFSFFKDMGPALAGKGRK